MLCDEKIGLGQRGISIAQQFRKCGQLKELAESDSDCCRQSLEPVCLLAGARAPVGTHLAFLQLGLRKCSKLPAPVISNPNNHTHDHTKLARRGIGADPHWLPAAWQAPITKLAARVFKRRTQRLGFEKDIESATKVAAPRVPRRS